MEVSLKSTLETIYAAKYGKAFDWSEEQISIFSECISKHSLDKDTKNKISAITIKRWFQNTDRSAVSLRKEPILFFKEFVSKVGVHKTASKQAKDAFNALIRDLSDLEERVNSKYAKKAPATSQSSRTSPLEKSRFIEFLFGNAKESVEETDIISSHIFGNDIHKIDIGHKNAAYFAAYRYSTKPGRVMKSFIAVLSPQENNLGFYSFAHIVRGTDPDGNQTEAKTRGILFNLAPATYMFGGTKRLDSRHITNFDVIAVERDELLLRNTVLLSALGISSAGSRQPIISRYALLRLGTKSSIGRSLDDSFINPSELSIDEVELSINQIVSNFKDIDIEYNMGKFTQATLAAQIVKRINNIPSAEVSIMSRDMRGYKKKIQDATTESVHCQGAIETHGYGPRV